MHNWQEIILFSPTVIVPQTSGTLASLEQVAIIEAARLLEKSHGVIVTVVESKVAGIQRRAWRRLFLFNLKRALFSWALWFLNAAVTLVIPRKKMRIVATDYWRNMYPLLYTLREAEVYMLDRGEVQKAGFRAILRHRMRFSHLDNFVPFGEGRKARRQARLFGQQWAQQKDTNRALSTVQFRGIPITPLVERALTRLIEVGTERAVRTIDGAYAMLEHLQPDLVWVRASVSGQIHFPALCYVARALGIPSLEPQHGIFYLGESAFSIKPPVQYIATYGPLVGEELEHIGFARDQLLNIGSPRFDVYAKPVSLTPAKSSFTVTCVMPAVIPESWSDSYEVVDCLRNLKKAVADIPEAFLILKLRPGPDHYPFYVEAIRRELEGVSYRIAQQEPMVDLFAQSDAIAAIYSTTVLESLVSGKPTVFNGTFGMHGELSKELSVYEKAGALRVATTTDELKGAFELLARDPAERAAQAARAGAFMAEHYSFDGKASQRLADTIRDIVKKPRV